MGLIQQIFQRHAGAYLARFGDSMPANHKKVIAAIRACRTEAAGSVLYQCEACGKPHVVARSCANRHCPVCQQCKGRDCLEHQLERRLPCPYFLLTFTVPEPLRAFLRSHQRIGYGALFEASAGAIKALAAEPKFIGGDLPGFLGVLHTWGRQLNYHPHIHYLVPGGALSSADRQWHPASAGFYLPVHALSRIFRAKFRDAIHAHGLEAELSPELWSIDWNVNCQPVGDGEAALGYLARYVFKVAIGESRVIDFDDRQVRFKYRKPHSNRERVMVLPVFEFMRRFLQHVLPSGFMKVRYFGFLSPSCAVPIEDVKARIELASGFRLESVEFTADPPPAMRCPSCGGALRFLRRVPVPAARAGLPPQPAYPSACSTSGAPHLGP